MKNIGILVPPRKGGGVYQYSISIANSLIEYSNKYNYHIICYDHVNLDWLSNTSPLSKISIVSMPPKKSSIINKLALLFNLVLNHNILNMHSEEEIQLLKNLNIDILIVPLPSLFAYRNNIPYIVSIPDLMHKYYPSFPEYPLIERLKRNVVYKNAAKYSVLTIVDDGQGVEDLNKFFKIPKEKIRVIPYIPPGYVYKYKDMKLEMAERILTRYNLPEKFIFYPAQFWYHKNHIRLIKALEYIKQIYKVKVSLVLVGYPKESYKKIMSIINKSDVSDQVIHFGYVSDQELVALYKKSYALVYPSLFGPTNIPPIEAMMLGTPVVCSNLFSMPEQVGDAGLLFDPFDVKDMAEKIYKIWTDEELRDELIKKGYERIKDLTLENYAKQWGKVIEEALDMIK